MNFNDAIRSSYMMSRIVMTKYIEDLDDADLLNRPGPGCNHLAWQLGHLLSSESSLLNSVKPGSGIDLPEGFADKHGKENCESNDPADFCTKQQYLDLMEKSQAAALTCIESMTDSELAADAPEHFRSMFPTVGDVMVLIASHFMMHVGQFVPVRRALGKPVVI